MKALVTVLIVAAALFSNLSKAEWQTNEAYGNYFQQMEESQRRLKEQRRQLQEDERQRRQQEQLDRIERAQQGKSPGFNGGGYGSTNYFGNW